MKKKYGLIKVLAILLLLVVVASYFIENRSGSISYIPLVDVFFNYIESYYYFFDTAVFILAVGGFYGLLNRIPGYKGLVHKISDKISSNDNEKKFVIIVTIVFAVLSSLTGLNMLFLIIIPFVVSIILLLGYDKLVALSATIGGTLVGFIGGIFVTLKDSSSSYSTSYITFDSLVGLDSNWGNLFPKILLLVIATGLLVFYIIRYIKKKEEDGARYELTSNDVFLVTTRDKSGKKKEEDYSEVRTWPVIVVGVLFIVLLILGYLPWADLFEISVFDDFHTWLTELTIGDYSIYTDLISSNFVAFGTWGSLGSFMMAICLMVFFGWILCLVYKVKFEEAMDGMVYGIKKMIPATIIAILAYAVLVCSYNNGFMETVITNASDSFGDNAIIHSLITMLGSVLNVDLYYTSAGIFTSIVSSLSDTANLSVYAVMFQSLYGLVQIVGPTSLMLIVGLSYLEVPYKTWVKYIWRFVLYMLMIIIIVLMIVSLL